MVLESILFYHFYTSMRFFSKVWLLIWLIFAWWWVHAFDCTTVTDVPVSECEVLVTLYDQTGWDNWMNNDNRLQTTEVWERKHVYVVSWNVDTLSLWYNNLRWTVPAELWQLSELRVLQLFNNHREWILPSEIWNLSNLEHFSISDLNPWGWLTWTIPDSVGDLTNLKRLSINKTSMTWEIPASISNLTQLEQVFFQLNYNLWWELPSFVWFSDLWIMRIRSNGITWPIPVEYWDLDSMMYLQIYDNNLSWEIPAELWNLNNLVSLQINDNELCWEIPNEVVNLNISDFQYDYNNLTIDPIDPSFPTQTPEECLATAYYCSQWECVESTYLPNGVDVFETMAMCEMSCVPLPVCGNGLWEEGEECDLWDQNGIGNCSEECTLVACLYIWDPVDENNLDWETWVLCNDGIDNDGDWYIDQFDTECMDDNPTISNPCHCGDGVCQTWIETEEWCPGDCTVCYEPETEIVIECVEEVECCFYDNYLAWDCTYAEYTEDYNNPECVEPVCGNNIVEQGEQCDDDTNPACIDCMFEDIILPVCGNWVLDEGEECDDGNTMSGDGCSSTCRFEWITTGGTTTGGSSDWGTIPWVWGDRNK